MILFWLICGVFVAIALAFVLPPLLQAIAAEPDDQTNREANLDVYREQLAELETDHKNGLVSAEQYQQDRDEVERRMLEDVSTNEVTPTKSIKPNPRPAYVVALAIPVIAIALYFRIGNSAAVTGAPAAVPPAATNRPEGNGEFTPQRMEANVAALAKRLEQNPNDTQGWIMLGRSYASLEKYSQASDAYAKATALKPDDADLWADYAFVTAMVNGKQLQGRPLELVKKALELDPENPKALELAGTAAFETKNYNEAVDYWQRLLRKTPPESELGKVLTQRIAEAKSLASTKAK